MSADQTAQKREQFRRDLNQCHLDPQNPDVVRKVHALWACCQAAFPQPAYPDHDLNFAPATWAVRSVVPPVIEFLGSTLHGAAVDALPPSHVRKLSSLASAFNLTPEVAFFLLHPHHTHFLGETAFRSLYKLRKLHQNTTLPDLLDDIQQRFTTTVADQPPNVRQKAFVLKLIGSAVKNIDPGAWKDWSQRASDQAQHPPQHQHENQTPNRPSDSPRGSPLPPTPEVARHASVRDLSPPPHLTPSPFRDSYHRSPSYSPVPFDDLMEMGEAGELGQFGELGELGQFGDGQSSLMAEIDSNGSAQLALEARAPETRPASEARSAPEAGPSEACPDNFHPQGNSGYDEPLPRASLKRPRSIDSAELEKSPGPPLFPSVTRPEALQHPLTRLLTRPLTRPQAADLACLTAHNGDEKGRFLNDIVVNTLVSDLIAWVCGLTGSVAFVDSLTPRSKFISADGYSELEGRFSRCTAVYLPTFDAARHHWLLFRCMRRGGTAADWKLEKYDPLPSASDTPGGRDLGGEITEFLGKCKIKVSNSITAQVRHGLAPHVQDGSD